MSVLVTGSAGFLGGAVVERLLAHGERHVRCLQRSGTSGARLDALQRRYPEAHLERVDGNLVRRDDAERALGGATTVYHLAAALRGAPADIFWNTVVGSRRLLEAASRSRPRKIVLVSSIGVYGVAELAAGEVITEEAPLDRQPERRDPYTFAKHRQEGLFWEYRRTHDVSLVVLRPGVIYGPGGLLLPARVGLRIGGVFLHLGGRNPLPLTFVDNAAEAVVLAGLRDDADGEAFNVLDDDLPTSAEFLRRYRREVENLRSVRVPYALLRFLSVVNEKYHARSRGQLPAVLTPYRTASAWKHTRFDNSKLKRLGWRPLVGTDEGLARTFAALKSGANP